jgi:hypothetical protein
MSDRLDAASTEAGKHESALGASRVTEPASVGAASEQTQARLSKLGELFEEALGEGAARSPEGRLVMRSYFNEAWDIARALLADLAAAEQRASEMEAHANALANRDETVQQAYEALRAAERERDEAQEGWDVFAARMHGAEARAERLTEALAFYADSSTYVESNTPHPTRFGSGIVPIDEDEGLRAREALAAAGGGHDRPESAAVEGEQQEDESE